MKNDLSTDVEFLRPSTEPLSITGVSTEVADVLAFDPQRVGSLIRTSNLLRSAGLSEAELATAWSNSGRGLEVIIGEHNILPAWFLEVGPTRATAVCKIEAEGTNYKSRQGRWAGTGFLIADSILLTNHHVLNSIDTAQRSECVFNYQRDADGKDMPVKRFRLRPERLFVTSPTPGGLDFTFVWVDGEPGKQFGVVPFNRDFFVANNSDVANIIQHPGGDYKGVTLQENKITTQDEAVVHYTSDTQPGSSGSCVFNNKWMPFALHHASTDNDLPGAKEKYVNEGIRFSAIVAYLEKLSYNDPNRDAIIEVLQHVNGTDPILGYHGALGRVVPDSSTAVETVVNLYKGEAGDIDIGFWNLEWFNLNYEERIPRVAEVIAKMNLDIWAFEETSPEATRRLTKYLKDTCDLDFGYEFSEPLASPEKQTTTVIWNKKTVSGKKQKWPANIESWLQAKSQDFDDLHLEAVEGKIFDRYPALYSFSNIGSQHFDFHLVPLHLKAKSEGSKRRRMAAAILGAAINEMIVEQNADQDWVVGGDFNASLASDDFEKLISGGLVPLSAEDELGGAFSYVKGPKSLIDHIFLSPNLAKTSGAKDFLVVAHDKVIPNYVTTLSDHRPVLVRLSLKHQKHTESLPMKELENLPTTLRDRLSVLDWTAERSQPSPARNGEMPGRRLNVPLSVSIEDGELNLRISAKDLASVLSMHTTSQVEEAISVDPDYSTRKGYQENFLGTGNKRVPLPSLTDKLKTRAALRNDSNGPNRHVLTYHHYSVVMNKERRLAFFTAVNIDGNIFYNIKRETDRWIFDPRISKSAQTGNDVYLNNPLDRGHLVRRLDPAWGDSSLAKVANDDTFHYTNCSPQHHSFNAGSKLWGGLENYILQNADALDFKVSVFTGPVFGEDDDEYRGVKLPRQFWKVVVMVKANGKLSATGYLLSQEDLIQGIVEEAFQYGAYETFQVPVKRIEKLTGVSFGQLRNFDPLDHLESNLESLSSVDSQDLKLKSFGDIRF